MTAGVSDVAMSSGVEGRRSVGQDGERRAVLNVILWAGNSFLHGSVIMSASARGRQKKWTQSKTDDTQYNTTFFFLKTKQTKNKNKTTTKKTFKKNIQFICRKTSASIHTITIYISIIRAEKIFTLKP